MSIWSNTIAVPVASVNFHLFFQNPIRNIEKTLEGTILRIVTKQKRKLKILLTEKFQTRQRYVRTVPQEDVKMPCERRACSPRCTACYMSPQLRLWAAAHRFHLVMFGSRNANSLIKRH
jgi:hypothetical protein